MVDLARKCLLSKQIICSDVCTLVCRYSNTKLTLHYYLHWEWLKDKNDILPHNQHKQHTQAYNLQSTLLYGHFEWVAINN